MGNRIAKYVYNGSELESSTFYVRDAQGTTIAVYDEKLTTEELNGGSITTLKYALAERHIYGSSRLGMDTTEVVIPNSMSMTVVSTPETIGSRYLGKRLYELSNHLGNVLTVISDRKMAVPLAGTSEVWYYRPHLVSVTDYSPFGVALTARTWSDQEYRYGFNGKELDNEGMGGGATTYDYGFRIYNAALGKFLSVDPLSASYPWYTPYQFAGNKPIWAIDLDGLEELNYNEFRQGLIDGYDLLLKIPFPEVVEHPSGSLTGTWKINEDNQFWTLSGETYSMKDGVSPSQALMDFFENPQNYSIDCAQFIQLERLYAMHNSMGDEEFDAYIERQRGNFEIKQHKSTGVNSYKIYNRGRDGNLLPKGGRILRNIRENAFYNKLPIGSRLWIGSKGYKQSAYNGENIVKVGRNRYNAQGIGENMTLRQVKRALKEKQTPIEGEKQTISVDEVEIYKGNIEN